MVIPILVDENGKFLSYSVSRYDSKGRVKRDARARHTPSTVFYRISAFGQQFHFKLKVNRELFSRFFSVGAFGDHGKEMTLDTKQNCHYVGYSRKPHVSTAAISNCFGLVNIISIWNIEFPNTGDVYQLALSQYSVSFFNRNLFTGTPARRELCTR